MAKRTRTILLVLAVLVASVPVASAGGPTDPPNDAGSGTDAPESRSAAIVVQPGTHSGSIGWLDDADWYAFDMPEDSRVCLAYENGGGWSSFTPGFYAYDGQGRAVSVVRDCGSEYYSWRFDSATGGRHFLSVRASLLVLPSDYTFTLTYFALPNNTTLPPPPPPPVPPPPAPALTSIEPARGAPGAAFTLLGDHFQPGAKARFGGVDVALQVNAAWTPHRAAGVVPQLDPGTYNVSLVNPDGQLSTLLGAFEVTLAADPGFLAGDLVITRRPVQVEGQAPQSTPFDMRRVTVTVHNLGYGATTEPVWLYVTAEPDGRIVPVTSNARTLAARLMPAGIDAGGALTVAFAWDTKGFLGDYIVRAKLSPSGPQLSGLNDELTVEHTVAVSGLGGL